jgi:hypothetical protein
MAILLPRKSLNNPIARTSTKGGIMKKVFLLVVVGLFLVSCSHNIKPVVKENLPPYQGTVAVYFSKNDCTKTVNDLPKEYTVIADLEYYNWGKFRNITVEDVTEWLQDDARKVGANAIIIDSCNTVYSCLASRGKNAKARAILLK